MGDCWEGWEESSWEGWCQETPTPVIISMGYGGTNYVDWNKVRQHREDEEIIVL